MARTLYGGSPADVIAQVSSDDGDLAPYVTAMSAWDSQTAGSQLTDLQTPTGSPIGVVTPDSFGRVVFLGPDGFVASIWLQDSTGYRWRIDPANLASRTGGVSSVTVNGIQQTGAVSISSPPTMTDSEAAAGVITDGRLISPYVLRGAVQTQQVTGMANVYYMPVWDGSGSHPVKPGGLPSSFVVVWRQPTAPLVGSAYSQPGDEWETTA